MSIEYIASIVGIVLLSLLLLWILARLINRCTMGVCTTQRRLDNKVVIITGSNSGIGMEAAKVIAMRGAKVILACRNVQKAEKVAAEIRTEHPGSNVTVKQLDLCRIQSIRDFANEVLKEEDRLDILVNNAGLAGGPFNLTEDGYEEVYQANYLGPFLLTELLLPLLKKSTPARIVNTGSSAYFLGSVDPTTLAHDVKIRNKASMRRYGDSKLAMLMWTRAMGEELKNSGVTINVLHPGIVATPLVEKHSLNLSNLIFRFNIFTFGRTAKQGAQTIIYLCLSQEVDMINGEYWSECRPAAIIKGRNMETNFQLVAATRRLLGLL